MIRMTIKTDLNFPLVEKAFEETIKRGLQKGAFAVERSAKTYAPYWIGRLTASINTYPVEKTSSGFLISVGPTVDYGLKMEMPGGLGPRSLAKGSRRPYLKPSMEENKSNILRFLTEELRRI